MLGFIEVIQYFVHIAAVVIVINSLLLMLCLISIRPNMRKKESMYIGLIQSFTEFCIGIWLLISRPIFIDIDFNFLSSLFLVIAVIVAMFVRLYFFNALRFLHSR